MKMEEGDAVMYVDAESNHHHALVTTVFGTYGDDSHPPSVNVVYVSNDEKAHDQYGRQLAERATSIVHQKDQRAPGLYWYEA